MKGNQKKAYDSLNEVNAKLKDGFYGRDDDVDLAILAEDLDDAIDNV